MRLRALLGLSLVLSPLGVRPAAALLGFDDVKAIGSNASTDSVGEAVFVGLDREARIATDGSGTWIAVWASSDPALGGTPLNGENLVLTRSTNDGKTWSPVTVLDLNATNE
ncbi:MAG TPA: hypothetical protein VN634_12735 [Candidatus Limnocylindrales bacterium]|nr:hypothetical protein [Candidatus Limnocylindrales bacterium]